MRERDGQTVRDRQSERKTDKEEGGNGETRFTDLPMLSLVPTSARTVKDGAVKVRDNTMPALCTSPRADKRPQASNLVSWEGRVTESTKGPIEG